MFNSGNHKSSSVKFRPRRCHQKSRNGCRECKRRRIKCDESKPSCTRCVLSLQKCVYQPSALFDVESGPLDDLPQPNPEHRNHSLSPITPAFSENSPFSDASAYSTPAVLEASYDTDADAEDDSQPSDTALYHHYLQHTSHVTTPYQNHKAVLQIYIPTLALQSKVVFHAILALSAACLCRDMIAKQPPPEVAAVNQILMSGYRHYNFASEETRDLISQPDMLKPEPLLASAPLLVGFATASQQINHWMENRKPSHEPYKLLSASLRDAIVLIKGLRLTLQVLSGDHVEPCHRISCEPEVPKEIAITQLESRTAGATPPPSLTHVMYPIFAATSQQAFSKLQERLDSTFLPHSEDPALAACAESFQRLSTIRDLTFSSPDSVPVLSINHAKTLPQLPSWLRTYLGTPIMILPNQPLHRPFLTFLIHASPGYLDLLLPLLDESLEHPMESVPDGLLKPTEVQALALDIFAHWCVLMFLLEEEVWTIGNLPFILLNGMLNRYGDDFVARLWPGDGEEQSRWWPASMLACLREIKGCQ